MVSCVKWWKPRTWRLKTIGCDYVYSVRWNHPCNEPSIYKCRDEWVCELHDLVKHTANRQEAKWSHQYYYLGREINGFSPMPGLSRR